MSYNYLPLDHRPLRWSQLQRLEQYGQQVSLTFTAHEQITACRRYLDRKMQEPDALYYGINTGFGYLQHVRIPAYQIEALQYNLIRSHACGMGDVVPPAIVKWMLLFKIKSLSYGHSGVQIETVCRLVDMFNENILPVIYTQGSLGASGDLAPLSHLSLPLIAEGEVWYQGERKPASEVWKAMNWSPIRLQSKEGLALINGTQFMSGYGIACLMQAERLLDWADRLAALSWDAFDCSSQALQDPIHRVRGHEGQRTSASRLRELLQGSQMLQQAGKQVQDPYSFRCIPQVHGASLDTWRQVRDVFLREINSVTDNPLVFPDQDLILSGGNFHGQPLALSLDYLSIAMSELANISERRIYQLISGQRGLPLFLVKDAGLHSGFMIPQYTAASIVSENKQLATPASVDSISSSNNQEDHVSMGANAAVKCWRIMQNVERVLAIELMTAAQALDFRRPLRSSSANETLWDAYRQRVRFNDHDRILHDDMQASVQFIRNYEFV